MEYHIQTYIGSLAKIAQKVIIVLGIFIHQIENVKLEIDQKRKS